MLTLREQRCRFGRDNKVKQQLNIDLYLRIIMFLTYEILSVDIFPLSLFSWCFGKFLGVWDCIRKKTFFDRFLSFCPSINESNPLKSFKAVILIFFILFYYPFCTVVLRLLRSQSKLKLQLEKKQGVLQPRLSKDKELRTRYQ